jgi:two-component system, cell cycle response regulator DivK
MSLHSEPSQWIVLIVDDEPDNLSIAAKVLTFYGASVYTASNGSEGLRQLTTIQPSVILLDLDMPILDGWTVLESIRRQPNRPYVPVIAFTAHAMLSNQERMIAAGFDDFILKPFDLPELTSTIKKTLENVNQRVPPQNNCDDQTSNLLITLDRDVPSLRETDQNGRQLVDDRKRSVR